MMQKKMDDERDRDRDGDFSEQKRSGRLRMYPLTPPPMLKTPTKILRLFGVNIPIYENDGEEGNSSRKRNPNQEEGILVSDNAPHKRTKQSTDDDDSFKNNPKILRLFDQSQPATWNSHGINTENPNAHQEEEEEVITIHEEGNPSRKRKVLLSGNSPHKRIKSTDDPKILRLFGVNIKIVHQPQPSTTCDGINTENPNAHQHRQQDLAPVVAAPLLIPLSHDDDDDDDEVEDPRILIVEGIFPEHHPVLLFEKELQLSDISRNHNRLLITGTHRLMAALTEEERAKVQMNYLRVLTTATNGVAYTLRLKKWAASGAIVLIHRWSDLVHQNRLRKGDSVQGWGYHVAGHFRLALTKVN